MGRWAHRKRTGGGFPLQNFIIDATISNGPNGEGAFAYQFAIDAFAFDMATFESAPSGAVGQIAFQLGPRLLGIVFDGPITGDTSVTYTGSTPGFTTPQTIVY